MLTRVSTYAMHQRTLRDVSRVQQDLATSQRQISSGKKADTFSELAGQVEFYSSIEGKMNRAADYQKQNDIIISRTEIMNGAVGSIIDIATELRNMIVTRRNPGSGQAALLTQTTNTMMDKYVNLLNTNVEGRFVFAGGKTDTPPAVTRQQNLAVGFPDEIYYRGDNTDLTTKASDSLDVQYGVRANEDGFKKLYAAMNLAVSADGSGSDTQLAQALDLVNGALDEIVAIQGRLNANTTTLKDTNKVHTAQQLYWKGVSEEIANTDTVAVASKVAIDQSVLQGTFQVFSTIAGLSLLDYLR